jgi:hypothetical protein
MISLYLFLNIHAPFKNEHSKISERNSIYPIERIKMAHKNYIKLFITLYVSRIGQNTNKHVLQDLRFGLFQYV